MFGTPVLQFSGIGMPNPTQVSLPIRSRHQAFNTAASSFGLVQHMLVYVNRNALNYAPQVVRERKESNRVVIKAGESNGFWEEILY